MPSGASSLCLTCSKLRHSFHITLTKDAAISTRSAKLLKTILTVYLLDKRFIVKKNMIYLPDTLGFSFRGKEQVHTCYFRLCRYQKSDTS